MSFVPDYNIEELPPSAIKELIIQIKINLKEVDKSINLKMSQLENLNKNSQSNQYELESLKNEITRLQHEKDELDINMQMLIKGYREKANVEGIEDRSALLSQLENLVGKSTEETETDRKFDEIDLENKLSQLKDSVKNKNKEENN